MKEDWRILRELRKTIDMELPKLSGVQLAGKDVIVRGDLDTEILNTRLAAVIETTKYILEKGAKRVVVMGHRGRPHFAKATRGNALSLENLVRFLEEGLGEKVGFIDDVCGQIGDRNEKVILLENLRFWKEEDENNAEFARTLSKFGEVYVNEAFATSHRNSASIVGLPKLMKEKVCGLRFEKEIENLGRAFLNPKRPVVILMGGAKEDKIPYIESLAKIADKILVGGRLPKFLEDFRNDKVVVAKLNQDGEDITVASIERFEKEIEGAGTVVAAGPLGRFEDVGQRLGTERVFGAIAKSSAYKIAGGGDTESAIKALGLEDKFDWISVGGGAMLELLATGTLPGIEALVH